MDCLNLFHFFSDPFQALVCSLKTGVLSQQYPIQPGVFTALNSIEPFRAIYSDADDGHWRILLQDQYDCA